MMKLLIVISIALAGAASWFAYRPAGATKAAAPAGKRTPVVVELFTSEGCSSCPPADLVLRELEGEQPVEGAEIIALSEHVDYWNYIGWSDPFSSAAFSARQEAYAGAFGTERIYTPQMIVDGQAEFVGSNAARAREAVARAIRAPRAEVTLTRKGEDSTAGLALDVRVRNVPAISSGDVAEVIFAITEGNLASNVTRGENTGRKLPHTAVVRELRALGAVDPATKSFSAEPHPGFALDWKRENLRAIVFVQERAHRRILGAASLRLGEDKGTNP